MQVITIDFFILILGVIIVAVLKSKHRSLFFLASKVNIFLPLEQRPDDDTKKRRSKKREDAPLKITEARLEELSSYPLYNEYEKLFMLTMLLLFHWTASLLLRSVGTLPEFLRASSSLPYYLTLLLLVYGFAFMWKVATHNGFKSLELQ